jgi:hypothetical protein
LTGVALNWTEIDGMEFLLIGYGYDDGKGNTCNLYVTQGYVIVDCTPLTATFQPKGLAVGVDQRY